MRRTTGRPLHWAQEDLKECFEQEEKLKMAYDRADQAEKEIISGMLNELQEKMEMLCRHLLHDPTIREKQRALAKGIEGKKKKVYFWDPKILHEMAVEKSNVEDEVIEKLCPSEKQEKIKIDIAALNGLTEKQRDVLILISNGYTRSQVAKMYGKKKGTINKHFTLARRRLRESFFIGQNCLALERKLSRPTVIDMHLRSIFKI